nr:Spy/CpxP family protein refolding chaperone [Parabacteroides goldsteinii]
MKKVIGLFLVILISSTTVFAQSGNRQGRKGDPSKRSEKIIEELKLDDKQAADFRKVEADFREQMKKEREAVKEDREKMREKMTAMRTEKDAQIKKILTDEQYNQYLERQKKVDSPRKKGHGRK